MRCPKSRFPIRIIVFDELELIIFVSQGLTLSTASLVFFIIRVRSSNTRNSLALFTIVLLFILCNIPRLCLNMMEWNLRNSIGEDVTDEEDVCDSSR